MERLVYIVSDPRDTDLLLKLVTPLKAAGFKVVHNESVEVGDSLLGAATLHLRGGVPVVLCGTANAVGRKWSRKLINAAHAEGSKVLVVEMEEGLDLDALSLNTVSAKYYENPGTALEGLIRALNTYFPAEVVQQPVSVARDEDVHYLDQVTSATVPSIEALAAFRGQLRDDIVAEYPESLSTWEFLQRTCLVREGRLTRVGVLLFGENASSVMPSAVVECCQYDGIDRTAPSAKTSIHGTLQKQVELANKYIADRVWRGEAVTSEGPYAQPIHGYPMVAVREIIANAVAHRDYSAAHSCVHVRLFTDRIEITNPGTWLGRELDQTENLGIDNLTGDSRRRNFRLASMLTWIRLVEGEGKGLRMAVADCAGSGTPVPTVHASAGIVTVTIFRVPRSAMRSATQPVPVWGREIPFRNPHFTGRARELGLLREQLESDPAPSVYDHVTVLHGLGGVGKTEIAAEYCHRYARDYDLVWWVRAEQEDTIRDSLIALGRRMGMGDFHHQERDYSAQLVLDALRSGDPYARWLLVFDNALDPAMTSRYIPQGEGRVIVTSRAVQWRRHLRSEGIDVAEFSLAETIEFLRRRVESLGPSDDSEEESARTEKAALLAHALDNLPLAAEHAAAFLVETGTPVSDYLELFERNAHELLGTDVDIYYPASVATTWSVSRGTLSAEADALFQLLAFFSPEPISEELLVQPSRVGMLPEPLQLVLGDLPQFRRSVRELARFSLVKIFGARNVLQVHRVVQAVTRGRLEREDPEFAAQLRSTVHTLLAASDPGSPEYPNTDLIYERSRHHLVPSGALESDDPQVGALIINQVRHMALRGDYAEGLSLGESALGAWREHFGKDASQTLRMAVEVSWTLARCGRVAEAGELVSDTLERLREHYGESDDTYLRGASVYGTCLRGLGHFHQAYEHDIRLLPLFERHLRTDAFETLSLRHNIAIDLRCLGRYQEAMEMDQVTLATREQLLGPVHIYTMNSRFAVARNLRQLGRYKESLDLVRELTNMAADMNEPWHLERLFYEADLAVSLRHSGFYKDAREQGEAVLKRHTSLLGPEHRQTLTIATNLINDRRLDDDLYGAQDLGRATVASLEKVVGAEHPGTLAAVANLAVVLRTRGDPIPARDLNERAMAGMTKAYGSGDHPDILVVATNLASDLAAVGEIRQARDLGEKTLDAHVTVLGESHPHTLASAANLALDRQAFGDDAGADTLFRQTSERCDEMLSPQHPTSRQIRQRGRVNLDIDPMSA